MLLNSVLRHHTLHCNNCKTKVQCSECKSAERTFATRAVYIEVIKSLDTCSFINALKCFLAVRRPVKHIRSDRGTNFVGACKDLKISSNIDSKTVKTFLLDQRCNWTFNPPHASHCGGTREEWLGFQEEFLIPFSSSWKTSLPTRYWWPSWQR